MVTPTPSALRHTTLSTPAGPLTVIMDADTIAAAGFTDDAGALVSRLPASSDASVRGAPVPAGAPAAVRERIMAYFDGDLRSWDALVVDRPGAGYHQQVWDVLRGIEPGRPITYAQLAVRSSAPTAVRAAASACARNPIAPFVPCHRIVRSDGGLGGYAFGLDVKRWLLDHEQRHAA